VETISLSRKKNAVEATNAIEINQNDMPTKSFGSRVVEDANTFEQVNPSNAVDKSVTFAFESIALIIVNPLF
jgi:hypothetical protein